MLRAIRTNNNMRSFCLVILLVCLQLSVSIVLGGRVKHEGAGRVVKRDERTSLLETGFGSISGVDIEDGTRRNNNKYHLEFITLEPNALFLPVLLHADMVFYVRSGSGILSWTEGEKSDKINKVNLQEGDLYVLRSGDLFYLNSRLQSDIPSFLEPELPSLRITAIFTDPDEEELQGPFSGPYSSINDIVRGFDKPVLQSAFQVPEEVIEELTNATETPVIVHAEQQSKRKYWQEEIRIVNAVFGFQRYSKQAEDNKKKHSKSRTFNFFREAPDFENCYGWSKVVSKHDLKALHGSQIGVYMVNLTEGSMMGPHWNPLGTEVFVVLEGEGIVQVVCPSRLTNKECKNTRVRVEEGDVVAVPRFHPMAQISFNNASLVYLGFSPATSKKNRPQFLAGKDSILQTLDEGILGISFDVSNTTVGQLLTSKNTSILSDCTSCAEMMIERPEEEERKTEEEKEEERRRRKEEEQEGEGGESERRQEKERRRIEEEQQEGEGRESEGRHEKERRRREEEQQEEERRREDERARREEEREGGEEEFGEETEESQEVEEEGEGRRWKYNKMKINKRETGSYRIVA